MPESLAVIGMGQMGSAIAERLQGAGYDVVGYDLNAEHRVRLLKAGFRMVDTIREAVQGSKFILTSLPDSKAVRDAWLGAEGVIAHASPCSFGIELSTIDPGTVREVDTIAGAHNIAIIDCPVSGSPNEARAGRLVLIAGGKLKDLQCVDPVLKLLGSDCKHTGEVGTAKVVKIVNNMMSMSNVVAAAEAFALGVAAGVEPEKLYEVLSVSGGRSHHFTKRFPNALKGDFSPGFKIELGEKDLALGIELGRNLSLPTPTASAVRALYSIALAEGFRGQDIVSIFAMYKRWAAMGGSSG